MATYKKEKFIGFNPTVKRTVAPRHGVYRGSFRGVGAGSGRGFGPFRAWKGLFPWLRGLL